MRRNWTDRQLAGLQASADSAGVTLIGRRLENAENAERLQAAGIVLGQGSFTGEAVSARHLHEVSGEAGIQEFKGGVPRSGSGGVPMALTKEPI